MDFLERIKEALGNIFSSKLRSTLAMLGILVGTASVVAMVSSGQLATEQALEQFKTLGTDLLSLTLYDANQGGGGGGGGGGGSEKKFELKDALAIPKAVPDVLVVAPYTTPYAQVSFQNENISASLIGATADLQSTIKIKLKEGRFISPLDASAYFCVIGNEIYEKMQPFLIGNAVGKQIRLGDNYFTIIGVADKWPESQFFNQNINGSIIIPIETSNLLSKYAAINNIAMRINKQADIDAVQAKLTNYINKDAKDKQLFFHSPKQLLNSMASQRRTLTIFLGLIGSVSLFVGGIGVMNIMLVSVVERKREIGIRRAIGAKRWDIQMMFLIEAIILALLGGLLGVITGVVTSLIIAFFAGWPLTVYLLPPLIGFTVSVFVGVFFGFYPAYQASRLNPIQTLRSD
ncbi:ABC transporter permease [soil metagenome]